MTTGISNRALKCAIFGGALMGLAGCMGGGEGFSFASADSDPVGDQIGPVIPKSTSTQLARGAVTVKAPKGYCIDDSSVSTGLTGSTATLAKCTALDGRGAAPDRSAVMTVAVSNRRPAPQAAPTADDLAAASAPLEVLAKRQQGTLSMVQLASGGDRVFAPADPKHWRGVTTLDTRLILLAVYAPAGAVMAGDQGADLMRQLARGISATRGGFLSRSNAPQADEIAPEESAADARTTKAVSETQSPGDPSAEKGLGRVFGRLFNRS